MLTLSLASTILRPYTNSVCEELFPNKIAFRGSRLRWISAHCVLCTVSCFIIHVCECTQSCVWRPEEDVRCCPLLFCWSRSLLNPKLTHSFSTASWQLLEPACCEFQTLRLRACIAILGFYVGAENFNSSLLAFYERSLTV